MANSSFEQEENKRTARVALGFLSRFQEQSGNQMAVASGFVAEHFSKAQLDRLVAAGALQADVKTIDGYEKRIFNVAKLEELSGWQLADVRVAAEQGISVGTAACRGAA